MEWLKKKYRDLPLRSAFIFTVMLTFCIVVALSGLSIWGCLALQRYLLPDSNEVYLTLEITDTEGNVTALTSLIRLGEEMTSLPMMYAESDGERVIENYDLSSIKTNITKVERGYDILSSKRKFVYRSCGVLMIALPAVFSMAGILFCGYLFYRYKLDLPLKLLSEATEQIADKNLDFHLTYGSGDEMGRLCCSFEQMRRALDENNRELWKMLEERKMVQASIAHDLRNPIAVIEGYAEYLQMNLQSGRLTGERLGQIAANLGKAANRLGQYTESVRAIERLDEISVSRVRTAIGEFLEEVCADFSLMAAGAGKRLNIAGEIPGGTVSLDGALLYRVLENVFNNALRYAKETIVLSFELDEHTLTITVIDDGSGFSEGIPGDMGRLLMLAADEDGHRGLGLTISRLLCMKHDGRLELSNHSAGGAVVKIFFGV